MLRWVNGVGLQDLAMAFVLCEETDCKTGGCKTFDRLVVFAIADDRRVIAYGAVPMDNRTHSYHLKFNEEF